MQRVTHGLMAILVLAAVALPALAQDDETPFGVWQKDFELGLNLIQSTYSENWNGGDKGSIVWTGNFDGRMEKQTESLNWRNILKLTYGQTHNQERDGGGLYWKKPDKTDDVVDFESLLRLTKHSGWDPYVAFNFTSMFDDQSDPSKRGLMLNPMTFKPSAGISRRIVDTEDRQLLGRLGVAFLSNSRKFFTEAAPSTATQRESSNELAAEAVLEYKVGALDKRVDWESRLSLVMPFMYSGKSTFEDDIVPADVGLPDDIADYTTTLDVDWENTFTARITGLISVKLFVRWMYDKYDNTVRPVVEEGNLVNASEVAQAIRKAGQFKQTMALGFSRKF
ncbi:MAG: DUF3078 domain-containing protein [bacterium]|nr:DUF3078 domain-containing protein [bacterium]